MCIIFSVKWIFSLRVRHLCVLTPDPITEGTNQHTVYHSVSGSKLQLSELIKIFCISRSHFILRKTIYVIWATLYVANKFKKWSVWISRVYCSMVHDFWWRHPQDMLLSFQHDGWRTTFCELWTMFLVKTWPFHGQFGPKYDWACNLDGIIYHFIKFRKSLNAGIV